MVARAGQAFKENKKSPDDKVLATLLYHLSLSYRHVSDACENRFSYESARKWYGRIGSILPASSRIRRRVIAMDETKLKLEDTQIFIWSAIDVERYEVLALKASATRGELGVILFLNEVLKYCEGKRPLILVDHGPWYPSALEHLGLRYKQVTFGERNSVESWFNILKQKTKRFYSRFPFHSTMQSILSYLLSFMRIENMLILIAS